jgi:hypothetical protein
MIHLFKSRNPTIAFILALLVIVLARLAFIGTEIDLSVWQNNQAPLTRFVYNLLGENWLGNKFFNFSLSGLVVLFLAFYVNQLLNESKILGESGYLTAWIFILLSHMHPLFVIFSPTLISLLIIVKVFKDMYLLRLEKKSLKIIFNIGVLYSISFLFWYPSVMIMILFPIGFFTFNFFNLRVFIVFLVAFLLPFIYMAFYYFWINNFPAGFVDVLSEFHPSIWKVQDFFSVKNFGVYFFVVYGLAGLVSVINQSQKVVKEVRQFAGLLLFYAVLYLMGLFYQQNNTWIILLPLLFPFSIYIYRFVNTIKRKIVAELAHLSLILSVLYNFLQVLV